MTNYLITATPKGWLFSLQYKFLQIICGVSRIIRKFAAIQPARKGWVGQDILDSCFSDVAHRGPSACTEPHRGAGKGRFLNVIFYIQNFANSGYQKIPQRSVHFGRLLPLTYGHEASLCHFEQICHFERSEKSRMVS